MNDLIENNSEIFNANYDSFKLYLNEISMYPILSKEQEKELFVEYQNGNKSARDKIIKCNLRFVVHVSKNYFYKTISIMDLIQEGNLALVKAFEKFDSSKDVRFCTYAGWCIKKDIERYIAKSSSILKISFNGFENLNKIKKYINHYYLINHRIPDLNNISETLGYSKEEIIGALRVMNDVQSLDSTINENDITTLYDLVPDTNNDEYDICDISKLSEILGENELSVIKLKHGFTNGVPYRTREICEILNVPRTTVYKYEQKAYRKIRNYISKINK